MSTIRKSTVARELQPAFELLAAIRSAIEAGQSDSALATCERLAGVLIDIEQQVGSVTPTALFN